MTALAKFREQVSIAQRGEVNGPTQYVVQTASEAAALLAEIEGPPFGIISRAFTPEEFAMLAEHFRTNGTGGVLRCEPPGADDDAVDR